MAAPKLLFVKLHTTGLYRESLAQWDESQPVAVEIAHMLCDEQGNAINVNCNIVKSEGRIPQNDAIAVHGITNQMAAQWGLPEPRLVGLLADALKTLPYRHMRVVSYHEFDHRIVSASLARMGRSMTPPRDFSKLWEFRPQTEFIFLQEPWATQVCRLPSEDGGHRRPSLQEAEKIVLGRDRQKLLEMGLPLALVDLLAIKDMYLKFVADGLFETKVAA
jgi:hypothetical protein